MGNTDTNSFSETNNVIRGSYSSETYVGQTHFEQTDMFYVNDLTKLIDECNEEKKKIEVYLSKLEIINNKLLNCIEFLHKRCYFINTKHSNTINFVIANYLQLKNMLDNSISSYDNNFYEMEKLREKIYSIDVTVNNFKLNINAYNSNYQI